MSVGYTIRDCNCASTIVHQRTVCESGEETLPGTPELKQFRIEWSGNVVLHLVFDMPGRSMNVFSNAAIEELGMFASWLAQSDVAGVVIRSGKTSAFCAGADLAELETAYEMIMRSEEHTSELQSR